MSKMGYVKENGSWRLVDKEPQVIINEQEPLTLENLNTRVKRLEDILDTLMK